MARTSRLISFSPCCLLATAARSAAVSRWIAGSRASPDPPTVTPSATAASAPSAPSITIAATARFLDISDLLRRLPGRRGTGAARITRAVRANLEEPAGPGHRPLGAIA